MRKLYLIVVILFAAMMPASGQDLPTNLHTTFMKPGVHLELGSVDGGGGFPVEAFEMLRLKANGSSKPIHDLADLQGSVTIDSPQKAMDYVRLITSNVTYFLGLWNRKIFVEVTDRQRAKRMSNYGLPNEPFWKEQSGFMGILSEAAAKRSGLSMASVKPTHDGYIITRWLLTDDFISDDGIKIVLVEEHVSRDGTYRRRIVKQKSPPELPRTNWLILTQE